MRAFVNTQAPLFAPSRWSLNQLPMHAAWRLPLSATLLVAAILVSSVGCSSHGEEHAEEGMTEPVVDNRPPVPIITCKPVVKPIVEWDEYVARFEAVEAAEVRPRVSGLLQSANFIEGQIVKKDQVLFEIDPLPYQAEADRAAAAVNEAKSQADQARAAVAETTAGILVAKSDFDLAKKQYDRALQLRSQNAISQEDVDIRQSSFENASANYESANAKLVSAKAAVVAAESAIKTAMAFQQIADINLGYTKVLAPVSGLVGQRLVTDGNLVTGGTGNATLLTTIISIDPIHCVFDADEQSYLKYTRLAENGKRTGSRFARNPVYIALADEQGYPHLGQTDFVDNVIDQNTGTIRARAIFHNTKDMLLLPGLFARLRLPGSARYEAVLLPDLTIGSDQSEKYVYIVGADERIERVSVKLGPSVEGLRVIREGLTGSETVVMGGMQRVTPGQRVTPENKPIKAGSSDLPDDFKPVPRAEWIMTPRTERILKDVEGQTEINPPAVPLEAPPTPAAAAPAEPAPAPEPPAPAEGVAPPAEEGQN